MSANLVISENCHNFIVFKYKVIQTIPAMFTESKVTEIFFMADEFCKIFNRIFGISIAYCEKHESYGYKVTL